MKNNIYALILSFCILACQKNIPVEKSSINSAKAGKIEIITDSLIQGSPIIVRYYKQSTEEKDIYCSYFYSIKNDDKFNYYKMKSPSKNEAEYYEFVDTIPQEASVGNIAVYGANNSLPIDKIYNLAITRKDGKYENGAATNWMFTFAGPSNYLEYFNYERETYPNDYTAFVKKWPFELSNKLLTSEIISNDYNIIKNANIDSATKNVILLIASSLKNKKIDDKLLKKVLLLKDIEILNSEIVGTLLQRTIEHSLNDEAEKTLGKIVYNNPASKLTERAFASGEIMDWLSGDSLLDVGRKIYNLAPERSINIIYYLKVLTHLDCDSTEVIKKLSSKLVNRFFKQEHLKSGIDMNNHLLLLRSFIFDGLVQSCKKLNNEEYGINLIKQYDKFNKSYDVGKYSYYLSLAELYENVCFDSSCSYYAKAYKLNAPEYTLGIFSKFISKTKSNIDAQKLIDSLANNIQHGRETLEFDAPVLELDNNINLNINKLEKSIIIINSSTTCSFCHKEIKELSKKNLNNINFKPMLLFTDAADYKLHKEKGWLPKNYECHLIKNGSEVVRYFNMNSLPTTIVINNKNEIVYYGTGFDGNVGSIVSALSM